MEALQFRDIFWLLRIQGDMVGKLSQVFFVDLEIQSLVYDTEVHRLKEKRNFANSQVFSSP